MFIRNPNRFNWIRLRNREIGSFTQGKVNFLAVTFDNIFVYPVLDIC